MTYVPKVDRIVIWILPRWQRSFSFPQGRGRCQIFENFPKFDIHGWLELWVLETILLCASCVSGTEVAWSHYACTIVARRNAFLLRAARRDYKLVPATPFSGIFSETIPFSVSIEARRAHYTPSRMSRSFCSWQVNWFTPYCLWESLHAPRMLSLLKALAFVHYF